MTSSFHDKDQEHKISPANLGDKEVSLTDEDQAIESTYTTLIAYLGAVQEVAKQYNSYARIAGLMGVLVAITTACILILIDTPLMYISVPSVLLGILAAYIINRNYHRFMFGKCKEAIYDQHMKAHNFSDAMHEYFVEEGIEDAFSEFSMDTWELGTTAKIKKHFFSGFDKPSSISDIVLSYQGKGVVDGKLQDVAIFISPSYGISARTNSNDPKQRHVTIEHNYS